MSNRQISEDAINGNDNIQDENDSKSENIEDAIIILEAEFKMTPTIERANQLIAIYEELEDVQSVRKIREILFESMTLSEQEMWLDWLNDEMINAKTDEEKKAVLKLFEKALEDRLYYDVAKLCEKYTVHLFKEGVLRKQGARIMIEKLINKFCNDFTRGSKFLKKLRQFELDTAESPDSPETRKLVRNIYARQFKIPLADIFKQFDLYSTWEKDADERKKMMEICNTTGLIIGNHLDVDKKFCEALDSNDSNRIVKVLQSISNESNFTLERKMTYFERCFERNPIMEPVWELYTNFARENIKVSSLLEPIMRRAYKNHPQNINFALFWLRSREKSGTETLELEKTALKMITKFTNNYEHYMLWLYICEVNVRVINQRLIETKGNLELLKEQIENFRILAQQAIEFFSGDIEANQQYIDILHIFWANIEVFTLKDKAQMNKIMEKYIHQNGSKYQSWVQYISFEQILGKINNVRSLIRRGIEVTKDDIHSMFNYAIDFERKFGSLEELEAMEQKYKEKISTTTIIIAEDQTMNQEVPLPAQEQGRPIKRRFDDMAKDHPGSVPIDRQENLIEDKKIKPTLDPNARRPVFGDRKTTVFVQNLPFSFIENDIKAIFANGNKIVSCRIPKHKDTGRSKGIAYLDFETEEDAKAALDQNGLMIDGRKLGVVLSEPPKKGKDDERTLFVNKLPFTVTEDQLKELFHNYADSIEEIRIPKDFGGHVKGFAYVVFTTKEKAEEALENTKKARMGDKKLIISIADSSKHHEQEVKASTVAFLSGLDFAATEDDIKKFFEGYGIKQIYIPRKKKTHKSQGFAFVEFENLYDFKRALNIQQPKILKRYFKIEKSTRPITAEIEEHEANEKAQPEKQVLSKKDAIVTEEEEKAQASKPLQKLSASFIPAQSSETSTVKKPQKEEQPKEKKEEEPPKPKTNVFFKNLFG